MESTDSENRLKKEKERQRGPKTEIMDETERKRDNGQGELTKKRGGTKVEARDRKNGLKKENERQLTRKAKLLKKQIRKLRIQRTERIDETTRRNDSGSQRQRE